VQIPRQEIRHSEDSAVVRRKTDDDDSNDEKCIEENQETGEYRLESNAQTNLRIVSNQVIGVETLQQNRRQLPHEQQKGSLFEHEKLL